jgi:hypothetical protein
VLLDVAMVCFRLVFASIVAYLLYLLAIAKPGMQALSRCLSHRAWHPVSALAYAALVLHFVPLIYVTTYLGWLSERHIWLYFLLAYPLIVALSLALALLVKVLIDRPLRRFVFRQDL